MERITVTELTHQQQSAQPPVSFVPTPSAAYRQHRKAAALTLQPGAPRAHLGQGAGLTAPPPHFAPGSRVLMWKQDPSVREIGTRKVFLPGIMLAGPRDARIVSGAPGIAPVSPNAFGDFVTMQGTPQFDAVHTYAVVRQTLTMYQRALAGVSDSPLPWQWNSSVDVAPLEIFPYGLPNVMNAYYSRSQCCLKFGDFIPSGQLERVFTCRSLDIVAHETGHAVLDGLKPEWLRADNPPQTGGLHEAFGDLTAIFLSLAQLDQCEAIVAQTRANLHDKTFLADIAEEFGLALGRSNGLRNADNDITLSQAGAQVHALSQVFTGAVYDILADIFSYERAPALQDDAAVLHQVGDYLRSLVLRAVIAAPDHGAQYAEVVNAMLRLAHEDGQPAAYCNAIRNRFVVREVVCSPLPLDADYVPGTVLEAGVVDQPGAAQDRSACCGTMHLAEYCQVEHHLEAEVQALATWCAGHGRTGPGLADKAGEASDDSGAP